MAELGLRQVLPPPHPPARWGSLALGGLAALALPIPLLGAGRSLLGCCLTTDSKQPAYIGGDKVRN